MLRAPLRPTTLRHPLLWWGSLIACAVLAAAACESVEERQILDDA
jgi:hypothetical protein